MRVYYEKEIQTGFRTKVNEEVLRLKKSYREKEKEIVFKKNLEKSRFILIL